MKHECLVGAQIIGFLNSHVRGTKTPDPEREQGHSATVSTTKNRSKVPLNKAGGQTPAQFSGRSSEPEEAIG
jgi:hypothetical protein